MKYEKWFWKKEIRLQLWMWTFQTCSFIRKKKISQKNWKFSQNQNFSWSFHYSTLHIYIRKETEKGWIGTGTGHDASEHSILSHCHEGGSGFLKKGSCGGAMQWNVGWAHLALQIKVEINSVSKGCTERDHKQPLNLNLLILCYPALVFSSSVSYWRRTRRCCLQITNYKLQIIRIIFIFILSSRVIVSDSDL